ncbi:MAG: DUF1573 domain-containing protein [Planctomycetes bacterium]|nr:DUF1573 domain-containing protein [Planctomycetota bacterium]
MHSSIPRGACLVLALLAGACHKEAPPPSGDPLLSNALDVQSPNTGVDDLIPNYTDRGIVILQANPQRPNFWDFDVASYGDQPTHVFRLKNLEKHVVTIRSMTPSCGCVQPTLRSADGSRFVRGVLGEDAPPFRVDPGAEFELEIKVDTTAIERMNTEKLVWVRMISDSESTPYFVVEAHLRVQRDFFCTPALVELGEVPRGYDKRASASVVADSRVSHARILGVERAQGPFSATVDETEVAGVPTWVLVVSAAKDAPPGYTHGKVVLRATGSDGTGEGRMLEVPVSANFVPRILTRPAQLRLDTVRDQATLVLECLVPGEKVALRKVRFEGPGPEFVVQTAAQNPDQGRSAKWSITLALSREGMGGGYTRTAVLELDDPEIPELRVPVTVVTSGEKP